MAGAACTFCAIRDGDLAAHMVLEDEGVLAFLDIRPVFPGHVLVVPRQHHETLGELPADQVGPLFGAARRLALAVEAGLAADGAFVALNDRVSQSVPHVHVHVVPRRRKDGLRGFFWPRQRYGSEAAMAETSAAIRAALGAASL